jgi:hypothetical protein
MVAIFMIYPFLFNSSKKNISDASQKGKNTELAISTCLRTHSEKFLIVFHIFGENGSSDPADPDRMEILSNPDGSESGEQARKKIIWSSGIVKLIRSLEPDSSFFHSIQSADLMICIRL